MGLLLNRAKENTATTGTGAVTLGGAVAPYQSFAAAGAIDGGSYSYLIEDGTSWELGTGVYSSTASTLTRPGPGTDPSFASSSGALLNLSGSATIACVANRRNFGLAGMTLLSKTANQAIAANTWVNVTWDAIDYDNLGAFSLANNTVITVPAGMKWARASAKVVYTNTGGNRYMTVQRVTGTGATYLASDLAARQNEGGNSVQAPWCPVVPGDTYHLQVNSSTTCSVSGLETNFLGTSRFQIEWAVSLNDLVS